ncbi:major facilitator superfamily domain-containing protein [Dipodascopsis uninucleata]
MRQNLESKRADIEKQPYTIHSRRRKIAIAMLASVASVMSPLAGSIYFPSINQISSDLNVSVELVNVTVTTFMIMQGLAPTFWGTIADGIGRRPVYIFTLSVFVAANIALALQHNYAALLVLRMLQSFGSSSTVALAAGTIGDIARPAERGSYMGGVTAGTMLSTAFAPVIGGGLSEAHYGWRSSFWFLTAMAGVYLIVLIIWMPETGRNIVGNGSVPSKGLNRTLEDIFFKKKVVDETDWIDTRDGRPRKIRGPVGVIKILVQKDVILVLLANALVYTSFYCITVAYSNELKTVYDMETWKIGICFLPYGTGCSVGSFIVGKILDRDFQIIARRTGFQDGKNVTQNIEFPIEKARLRSAWYILLSLCGIIVIWGWTFRANISYAASLVLLFFAGLLITAFFTAIQVLLVDLYPQQSASATAANNLIRCFCGAAGSAVVGTVVNAIGMGWTFVIVSVLSLSALPIVFIEMKYGQDWRKERYFKLLQEKEREQSEA